MTSLDQGQRARMADKIAEIDRICAQARIMPVITIAREADILPLADALAAGGLRVLEVTLDLRRCAVHRHAGQHA